MKREREGAKRAGKSMCGTRRRQSGGTEEEDKVRNAHERVRALRRKGRWEMRKKHREDDWRRREQ